MALPISRRHPDLRTALLLFKEVQATVTNLLRSRNRIDLQAFVDFLTKLLGDPDFNATSDIFVLATFFVMRELAPEEVSIEITDRNALSNDETDQAAAFAALQSFSLLALVAKFISMYRLASLEDFSQRATAITIPNLDINLQFSKRLKLHYLLPMLEVK
jgi:hypothetical protein